MATSCTAQDIRWCRRHRSTDWPNTAFIEQNRQVTVVRGRYKCSFAQDKPRELFDLQADPREWNNLMGKPGGEAIVAEMTKLLSDWRARTPDAPERSDKTMKNERKARKAAK